MQCVWRNKNDHLLAVVSLGGLSVVSKGNINLISMPFPCQEEVRNHSRTPSYWPNHFMDCGRHV